MLPLHKSYFEKRPNPYPPAVATTRGTARRRGCVWAKKHERLWGGGDARERLGAADGARLDADEVVAHSGGACASRTGTRRQAGQARVRDDRAVVKLAIEHVARVRAALGLAIDERAGLEAAGDALDGAPADAAEHARGEQAALKPVGSRQTACSNGDRVRRQVGARPAMVDFSATLAPHASVASGSPIGPASPTRCEGRAAIHATSAARE